MTAVIDSESTPRDSDVHISDAEFKYYLGNISAADRIAVDTETTSNVTDYDGISVGSLYDGRDYCMGISVAYRFMGDLWTHYFPFRHSQNNYSTERLHMLTSVIEEKEIIFHNSKFDLASLSTLGIYPTGYLWDTIIMAHMINEEFPSKQLDWLAKFVLKHPGKDNEKLERWTRTIGWSPEIPPSVMEPYARTDAEITYLLWEVFVEAMGGKK